jgi:two-component system chemotaxis response regulator CheY
MKILIAEDNELARVLLRNVLSPKHGYEISEASNGREAWEMLTKGLHPDLCIFDIMMPELSGLDLLRRIRADDRFKALRVIICSVVKDKQSITQVAALHVKHYILKPFKVEFVLQTVEQALAYAPRHPLEAGNIICDRLGIHEEKLSEMLTSFHENIRKLLPEIRTFLERASLSKALALITTQKEAGANLGAIRVASHFKEIEDTCLRAIQSPASSHFAEQLQYLNGLLDQVDAENQKLKDCIPKASAQIALVG